MEETIRIEEITDEKDVVDKVNELTRLVNALGITVYKTMRGEISRITLEPYEYEGDEYKKYDQWLKKPAKKPKRDISMRRELRKHSEKRELRRLKKES